MTETSAVILAGGLARRMGGGDKARLIVGGRTVLARTIDTIRPQVATSRSMPTALPSARRHQASGAA